MMESFKQACESGIIPWAQFEVLRKDFHVTVFMDGQDVYLFTPEYWTDEVIHDARDDAHKNGRRLVASGYAREYVVEEVLKEPFCAHWRVMSCP